MRKALLLGLAAVWRPRARGVDFRDEDWPVCEPCHAVPVPHGGDEVRRAAQADPNISCAVATNAVRKYFGADLRPVVVGKMRIQNTRCINAYS